MTQAFGVFCTLLAVAACLFQRNIAWANDIVVRPKPKAGPLDNPLKGWCPYPNAGPISQPYSMVFQYVPWREIEPIEGAFRFDDWEQKWNTGAAAGKHIIFRVYVDYPSKPSGLPDWLRQAGVKETAYSDHGGGESPDYNNPRMVIAMERLIAALGDRYNTDPRIAFIELGLLGFWGEWHTWPQEKLYASPATERRIIDAYRKAFPDKSLMVRYAGGYAAEQNWIGFHDDLFPADTDNGEDWSFLAKMRKAKRTNNWQRAVIGGEMAPHKARQWLGKDYSKTQTMLRKAHFTWVGPYCPALEKPDDDEYLVRSEELVRTMGYEFRLTEVAHASRIKAGQPVHVSLKGKNIGVAPFYYPWSVEWALVDSSNKLVQLQKTRWDIRRWKPGTFSESAELNFEVPAGTYQLGVGIRDPWLNRPNIRFANDLPIVDDWTMLSSVSVEE
jgi:hypothetical protein